MLARHRRAQNKMRTLSWNLICAGSLSKKDASSPSLPWRPGALLDKFHPRLMVRNEIAFVHMAPSRLAQNKMRTLRGHIRAGDEGDAARTPGSYGWGAPDPPHPSSANLVWGAPPKKKGADASWAPGDMVHKSNSTRPQIGGDSKSGCEFADMTARSSHELIFAYSNSQ